MNDFLLHLMDLPVIFSEGWFIYLCNLVLAPKHTLPLPLLIDRIDQKIWHVLKTQPCDIDLLLPIPHPQHTHTYMHTLFRGSLVGRDKGDSPTTQQIGLSRHVPTSVLPYVYKCWFCNFYAVFGHFVQNSHPLSKSQPIWETLLPVSPTFGNKRQVTKQ